MAGLTCPKCGVEAGVGQWSCSACGASLFLPPDQDPTTPRKSCTSCGGPTQSGWLTLQTGGVGAVTAFVLGGTDLGQPMTLTTETCTACGHIDLYRA
jgi:hypothetical protein